MPTIPYNTPYASALGFKFNFQNAFNTETIIAGITTGANLSSLSTIDGQQWAAISTLSSVAYTATGIASGAQTTANNASTLASSASQAAAAAQGTADTSITWITNATTPNAVGEIGTAIDAASLTTSLWAYTKQANTWIANAITSNAPGEIGTAGDTPSLTTSLWAYAKQAEDDAQAAATTANSASTIASYNTLGISSLSTTTSLNTKGISSLSTTVSYNTLATSSLSTIANFRPSFSIYVAPNGNDTTGTGSQQIPFSTINRAIGHRSTITSTIEVGIVIAPGTYSNAGITVPQNTFLIGAPSGEFSQAVNINAQIALQANGGQAGLYGLNLFPALSQCVIVNNLGTYNINACSFVNTGNYCFYQSLGTVYLTECRFTCPTTGTFTGIGSAGLSNPTLIMRDCVLTTSGHPTLVEYSGNLTMRQCSLTNTSALSNVSSLVVYNPVNNNNSCEISYCTLQYTSGTSALNKMCIRAGTPGATISTSLVNCVYNLLLCDGAQSGSGQHCIDKAAGSGPVSLSYGNLLGGATAYRIDGTISKTQYNSVP